MTKLLIADQLIIDTRQPFKERARKSEQDLLRARLVVLLGSAPDEICEPPEQDRLVDVDLPEAQPPPLTSARTTTAPPLTPVDQLRVEVLTI